MMFLPKTTIIIISLLQSAAVVFSFMPLIQQRHGYQQELNYKNPNDSASDNGTTTSNNKNHFIPNRPLKAPFPNGACKGKLITLPPSLHFELDTNPASTLFLPPREINVWLPPHYDQYPDLDFPVLYCHDGQNMIFDSSSWTGSSLRLAGALTRLSERGLLKDTPQGVPPILVLIPSSKERIGSIIPRRHLEYGDTTSPLAQAHVDLIAKTIKPLIDSNFRTIVKPEGNAIIGSSLGGQASFHLMLRHPHVFGKCACLSPAFQPGILSMVATVPDRVLRNKVLYFDNGGDDDERNIKVPVVDVLDHLTTDHWWNPGYFFLDNSLQMGIDAMKMVLDMRGVNYAYHKIAGGRHNERAWANRIDKPLLALYANNTQITDVS